MKTIALIAHDRKKQEMLEFVTEHHAILSRYQLIATATTGHMIAEQAHLPVTTFLSGPLGGDQQIGAKVAGGEVDLVIFLRDP